MKRRRATETRLVCSLRGGQITIPAEFRRQLGIDEDTLVRLTLEGDELRLQAVRAEAKVAGSLWLAQLYDLFAPVREEARTHDEAEVDAAIDQAVASSRRKRA